MDALTPEERAELNAWIAEHIYQWTHVRFGTVVNLAMLGSTERWYGTPPNGIEQAVPDYCTWWYAGPLFDRYEFTLDGYLDLYSNDQKCYQVFTNERYRDHELLGEAPTAPEAIAKAVKAYEEQKRT
jgi:hypothetical protein